MRTHNEEARCLLYTIGFGPPFFSLYSVYNTTRPICWSTCTCVCVCVCKCVCVCVCRVCASVGAWVCACVHAYICGCVCVCACVHGKSWYILVSWYIRVTPPSHMVYVVFHLYLSVLYVGQTHLAPVQRLRKHLTDTANGVDNSTLHRLMATPDSADWVCCSTWATRGGLR